MTMARTAAKSVAVVDQFDLDHRAGSGIATASIAPCLFVPREQLPRWCPSPHAYGKHLLNIAPFPDVETPAMRRGKWLEPCGRRAIRDEFGLEVWRPNGDDDSHLRRENLDVPERCYLDDVLLNERSTAVEYKSVERPDFLENWEYGPPDYPRAQATCQQLADPTIARTLIVAIVIARGAISVKQFEYPRDDDACQIAADAIGEFAEMLQHGRVPEYDGTESSYRAWASHYKVAKGVKLIDVSDMPETVWRVQDYYQASLDKAAAEKALEAQKFHLARVIQQTGANVIRCKGVPKDLRLARIEREGYSVQDTTYLDWKWIKSK